MLKLEDVLKAAEFSSKEIEQIKNYELVKGVMASADERDLAAKFALLFKNTPMDELKEIFITSSSKKDGDSTITQLVNLDEENPDFSELNLGAGAMAYLDPSSGDLNLSSKEMDALKALPKKAAQAQIEEKVREILLGRFNEYRQLGLEGVSPYRRGRKNHEPGKELQLKTELAVLLKKAAPAFHKYILEYPNAPKPDGLVESFSWINYTIDEKPTVVLSHKIGAKQDEVYVFVQRHFYVSRGHNSVQGIGGAFPTVEGGTIVVYGSRTSTDQVAGFGGSAKRAIGTRIMGGKIAENLETLRRKIEG